MQWSTPRSLCGLLSGKSCGLRWSRLLMGMKPGPYNAVRFYYWAEEFSTGNIRDTANPFGFDEVKMNLPGMETRKQSTTSEMNNVFTDLLSDLPEEDCDSFAIDIQSASDIHDKYNVFRLFRRGSESRAVQLNVSKADRYIVNWWRKKERAGASQIVLSIEQSYVDVSLA